MADTESVVEELKNCAERGDFEAAFALVRANRVELAKKLSGAGIRDVLKKTTKDRLLLSFLDGVEFGSQPPDKALVRLEKLISFQPGSLVLSKAWGLGKVVRLDYFYRRITVDFKTRRGHQFAYAAAIDTLESAPANHILVKRESDPQAFERMLKEEPGRVVREILASYGDLTLVRLEDICVANGFVKPANFKKFWEDARTQLKQDKLVVIPVRRTEPLQLKASAEDYGDSWMLAFSHETDPKLILANVRELLGQGQGKPAVAEPVMARIAERLEFAVTAARNVDDALYAKLACLVTELGLASPAAAEMREYLWERKRYIKAAAELPAREVGCMVRFLADSDEAKARLYAALPAFCFAAVNEIVMLFKGEEACRTAIGTLLKQPKAPATLVTMVVGKYELFRDMTELPPLNTILTHAIALGEGRQGGETLRMQNIIRRLFSDTKWLEKVFGWLSDADKALFFERFQASIAWDPSTHHTIVIRMTHIVPGLTDHLIKVEKKREYARVTSYRSFAMKKAEYLKLINEDMPANIKRIEFAKSYGDLSENAEYQYAKDEQRTLMQKQTVMQQELEAVKPGDFADASVDEVMPGVTVIVSTPDGEKTYHVLGEWDNDVELGILSFKTRLAANMLGKKAGDSFEFPGGEGATQFGRILQIKPLGAEIIEWMKLPAGMQI